MPRTGEDAIKNGTYIDEHGHETTLQVGQQFPRCPDGATMWWHEDLPVAKHMRWEAKRRSEYYRTHGRYDDKR